ncbi:hypothetical protein QL285_019097 [Trifolium repens]|nr:hypothetical protein QL285_019097 [Trifolium repens]
MLHINIHIISGIQIPTSKKTTLCTHRDRRSPRPSGLLVRNLPLDASRRNEGGSRRRARSISPRPYSRTPSPAREESKTRKLQMGKYRRRSRTPPPRGRKRYDDDRYGDTRSHRDRRSLRPSGLLVRNLPLDASSRNEGGSRRRARSISPQPYSRPPSPAREESKTRKLTKKWDSKKDISAPLAQSRARAHQLIIRDKRVELDGMLREYGIIAKETMGLPLSYFLNTFASKLDRTLNRSRHQFKV